MKWDRLKFGRGRGTAQLEWPDDAFDIAEDIPCPFCPGSFAHARATNRGCYTAHTQPACERYNTLDGGHEFIIQAVELMRERGMVPPGAERRARARRRGRGKAN